jgi:hypothetical protein
MKEPKNPQLKTSAAASEFLPDELLWAEGGHASDVVLTALADGQHAIVPSPVRLHVERCTLCMTHLGHAALLSLHSERELAAKAEYDRATAKRPLPRFAIASGLLVAVLGTIPSILDAATDGASIGNVMTHDIPLFLKGLGTLAGHLEPSGAARLLVTYAAATLLVCMGIAISRLPKKETSQ